MPWLRRNRASESPVQGPQNQADLIGELCVRGAKTTQAEF